MKKEDFYDALHDIDDKLISEADVPVIKVKKLKSRYAIISAAAIFAVVLSVGAFVIFKVNDKKTPTETDDRIYYAEGVDLFPCVEPYPFGDASHDSEMVEIPKWDDMIDCRRYSTVRYNGREYTTCLLALHPDRMGNCLGTCTASGIDYYDDDKVRSVEGKTYKVSRVSTDVAVAFKFNEDDEYAYVYADFEYMPETLGDFIDDLDLVDTLTVHEPVNGTLTGAQIVSTMFGTILSDRSAKLTVRDFDLSKAKAVTPIGVNVLGEHYCALWLSKDGYIETNVLGNLKSFYVGQDKIDGFLDVIKGVAFYDYDDLTLDEEIPE